MAFNPLDLLKALPIVASAIAGEKLLELLNPLGYTDTQHYLYVGVGAIIGGLYSISYLGGFAKAGNKRALVRMAIPIALVWSFDAPILRDKVIDVDINPRYTAYKTEYLKTPKTRSSNKMQKELLELENNYKIESLKQKEKDSELISSSKEKAKKIYLSNYKKYKWWNKKAEETGCSVSAGLSNEKERSRRINCISKLMYKPSANKELGRLELSISVLKSKIALIANRNKSTSNRELFLEKEIKKAEEDTFPMPIFYLIMFFVGWSLEVFFPHLKYWGKWSNIEAEKKDRLVTKRKVQKVEEQVRETERNINHIRIMKEHNNMVGALSSANEFIKWCNMTHDNFKMNRHIATLYAVIRATLSINPDSLTEQKGVKLTANNIQRFSEFINPNSKNKNSPYNVTPYQTKIRELLKKEKALTRIDRNQGWIIDETALKNVLKKL